MKEQGQTSLYIELLKRTLIDHSRIGSFEYHPLTQVRTSWKTAILLPIDRVLRTRNFTICKMEYVSAEDRLNGYDWPAQADTMIGMNRLNNIEHCVRAIVAGNVPGDFIEAGVWRGGAVILMRGLLKELGITDRKVWAADSFRGLPAPDAEKYEADRGFGLHREKILSVSLETVKNNFRKYDLLDDQVVFLEGWFKDTLPPAPVEKLALIRLDADMYESTMQALHHLYPKLSPGGFVIVDDYNAFPNCRQAVDEYRAQHRITEKMIAIDKEAVYWRKD